MDCYRDLGSVMSSYVLRRFESVRGSLLLVIIVGGIRGVIIRMTSIQHGSS